MTRWVAVLLIAAGCGCSSTSPPTQGAKAAADPVESLKALAARGEERLKARGKGTVANVRYDVKKTDSLVSPHTGEILFSILYEQSQPEFRIRFAFQNERWVFQDAAYREKPSSSWYTKIEPGDLLGDRYVPVVECFKP